jgi:hypothetical protein
MDIFDSIWQILTICFIGAFIHINRKQEWLLPLLGFVIGMLLYRS